MFDNKDNILPDNKWIPIQKVMEVVNDEEWKWTANQHCKYITLRVDMRDGHCLIKDRNDNSITLDALKRQAFKF